MVAPLVSPERAAQNAQNLAVEVSRWEAKVREQKLRILKSAPDNPSGEFVFLSAGVGAVAGILASYLLPWIFRPLGSGGPILLGGLLGVGLGNLLWWLWRLPHRNQQRMVLQANLAEAEEGLKRAQDQVGPLTTYQDGRLDRRHSALLGRPYLTVDSLTALDPAFEPISPPLPTITRSTSCFMSEERRIQERLGELQGHIRRLTELRVTLSRDKDAEVWEKAQNLIDTTIEEIGGQMDQYGAALEEIALARWQNGLLPLVEDVDRLTYDRCAQRLKALAELTVRGQVLLAGWEPQPPTTPTTPSTGMLPLRARLAQARRASGPAHEACVRRLQAALEACEQLRTGLMAQQVLAAVKATGVDKTPKGNPALTTALNELDVLTADAEFVVFQTGLTRIEEEFHLASARLEIEQLLSNRA